MSTCDSPVVAVGNRPPLTDGGGVRRPPPPPSSVGAVLRASDVRSITFQPGSLAHHDVDDDDRRHRGGGITDIAHSLDAVRTSTDATNEVDGALEQPAVQPVCLPLPPPLPTVKTMTTATASSAGLRSSTTAAHLGVATNVCDPDEASVISVTSPSAGQFADDPLPLGVYQSNNPKPRGNTATETAEPEAVDIPEEDLGGFRFPQDSGVVPLLSQSSSSATFRTQQTSLSVAGLGGSSLSGGALEHSSPTRRIPTSRGTTLDDTGATSHPAGGGFLWNGGPPLPSLPPLPTMTTAVAPAAASSLRQRGAAIRAGLLTSAASPSAHSSSLSGPPPAPQVNNYFAERPSEDPCASSVRAVIPRTLCVDEEETLSKFVSLVAQALDMLTTVTSEESSRGSTSSSAYNDAANHGRQTHPTPPTVVSGVDRVSATSSQPMPPPVIVAEENEGNRIGIHASRPTADTALVTSAAVDQDCERVLAQLVWCCIATLPAAATILRNAQSALPSHGMANASLRGHSASHARLKSGLPRSGAAPADAPRPSTGLSGSSFLSSSDSAAAATLTVSSPVPSSAQLSPSPSLRPAGAATHHVPPCVVSNVPAVALAEAIDAFLFAILGDCVTIVSTSDPESQVRSDLFLEAILEQWAEFRAEFETHDKVELAHGKHLVRTSSARIVSRTDILAPNATLRAKLLPDGCGDFVSTGQRWSRFVGAATNGLHPSDGNGAGNSSRSLSHNASFRCVLSDNLRASSLYGGSVLPAPRLPSALAHSFSAVAVLGGLMCALSVLSFALNITALALAAAMVAIPTCLLSWRGAVGCNRLEQRLIACNRVSRALSRVSMACALRTSVATVANMEPGGGAPPLMGGSATPASAAAFHRGGTWVNSSLGSIFGAASATGGSSATGGGLLSRESSAAVHSLAPLSLMPGVTDVPLYRPSGAQEGMPFTAVGTSLLHVSDVVTAAITQRRHSASANPLSGIVDAPTQTAAASSNHQHRSQGTSLGVDPDADDDDDGCVRVRLDESGTFLLPLGKGVPPIVLDGYHIHANLGIIGLEFSEVFTDLNELEDAIGKQQQQSTSSRIGNANICLWNHAQGAVTGFSDVAVVGRPFGDVLTDVASLRAIEARIRSIEREVLDPTYGFSLEPLIIHVVHKVHGSVPMQVTIAPITQPLVDPRLRREVDAMVGVLLLGVPVDIRSVMASVSLRNLALSEVVEQLLVEMTAEPPPPPKQLPPPPVSAAAAPRVHIPTYTEVYERRKRFHEVMASVALSELSSASAMGDARWTAVNRATIQAEFARLMSSAATSWRLSLTLDASLPDVMECDIVNINRVIRHLLLTAPLAGPRGIELVWSFSSPDSCLLYVAFKGMDPATAYRDLMSLSETHPDGTVISGGAASTLAIALREGGAFALLSTDESPLRDASDRGEQPLTNVGSLSWKGVSSSTAAPYVSAKNDLSSGDEQAAASLSISSSKSSSTGDGGDVRQMLTVMFPCRRHTGSIWTAHMPTSASVDQGKLRASRNGGCGGGSGGMMTMTAAASQVGGLQQHLLQDVMTVMLCEQNELVRHRFSVELWKRSHSVITVEGDAGFQTTGLKILRSSMRRIDVVHLGRRTTLPPDLLKSAVDFPEVVFYLEWIAPEDANRSASLLNTTHAEDGVQGPNGGVRARRRSLRPPDFAQPTETDAAVSDIDAVAMVAASLVAMPNVSLRQTSASDPVPITDALDSIAKKVNFIRELRRKREELENVMRQHRSSPWVKGKKLGRGTFGDVYEAKMTLTGGTMAVKIVRLPTNDKERLDSFTNEVTILCSVSHPNIVQYFYCEEGTSGEVNIFMELCRGGSLAEVIKDSTHTALTRTGSERKAFAVDAEGRNLFRTTALDLDEIGAILQQLLSALAYLHDRGIAHRDIKPANVLISNGCMKLADFGTARANATHGVQDTAGTMTFMAPDVYNGGGTYSLPCDIWSIGVLTLDLLGIEPPILKRPEISCLAAVPNDELLWDDLRLPDLNVESFLWLTLRVHPEDRATAAELLKHQWIAETNRTAVIGVQRQGSMVSTRSRLRSGAAATSTSGEGALRAVGSSSQFYSAKGGAADAAAGITPVAQLSRCLSLCSAAGDDVRSSAAEEGWGGTGAGVPTAADSVTLEDSSRVPLNTTCAYNGTAATEPPAPPISSAQFVPRRSKPRALEPTSLANGTPPPQGGAVNVASNLWRGGMAAGGAGMSSKPNPLLPSSAAAAATGGDVGLIDTSATPPWIAQLQRKGSFKVAASPSVQSSRKSGARRLLPPGAVTQGAFVRASQPPSGTDDAFSSPGSGGSSSAAGGAAASSSQGGAPSPASRFVAAVHEEAFGRNDNIVKEDSVLSDF